jgi:hypothetical protein
MINDASVLSVFIKTFLAIPRPASAFPVLKHLSHYHYDVR